MIYAKDYLVNTKVVNSKSYREKFERLPVPKQVQDALHKEAIHILNEVNGKTNEIVSALDARTGRLIAWLWKGEHQRIQRRYVYSIYN